MNNVNEAISDNTMNTGYPYTDPEKKRVKWDEVREVISQSGIAETFEHVSALDFKDLMRKRINNILLVSSMYDFYTLVEDGQLTEAIFNEYLELNLHYAPHITRVHSGEAALRMLGDHRFDLVISMQRISDMDLVNFCRSVKRNHPDIPVVFLGYQSRELQLLLQAGIISVFDRVFIWQGDRRLFLAIIKLFEDLKNAPVDCLEFGVRTIILVEDSPLFYSSYLPLIYTELIKQAQSLIVEGRNFSDKLLRQRARPKILHATSFDEAWEYFQIYKETLLGVITDMKFKKGGKVVDNAGLQLIQQVREEATDLPVLIQSAHSKYTPELEMLNVCYADKNSRTLLQEVSEFIKNNFGFGDFVFRMPDGTEIQRATNLKELRDLLKIVPDESIIFHGSRNHFSNWLMARTKFALAKKIKPVKISQFASMDELRSYLIEVFTEQLHKDQQGIISDFPGEGYDIEEGFLRIGSGSLGGKARGLAFVDNLLKNYLESDYFPGVRVSIPRTIVLGTDIFDQFLEKNGLLSFALQSESDDQIIERFVRAELPAEIEEDLYEIIKKATFPLAVRSSSLLEDALHEPFAGIYATMMIPNSSRDENTRFFNLSRAIKFIYASTFFRAAKHYIEATGNRIEEEKMAVIIQEMVGQRNDQYFYPHISGVARSYNFYPFAKAKPEDGVVNLALGLGKTIVDGGISLQFSPAYPTVYPQFSSARDYFRCSQVQFYALDLESDFSHVLPREDQHLVQLGIADAEKHGTLTHIVSTYSAENDMLYEGISRPGPRVIDFAPILKSEVVPLTKVLTLLLKMCETAMNCPVEIEFAVKLGSKSALPAEFSFLQVRPMVTQEMWESVALDDIPREKILVQSEKTLGNGIAHVRDIVYVKPDSFNTLETREIARDVMRANEELRKEKRPYILIGPGRWGSADPFLGIPVRFPAISGARAIVETSLPNVYIDPSQGSHFFQNITSFRISYFTIRHYDTRHIIDWDWLARQPVMLETKYIRRISLPEDIEIIVDGKSGKGVILKEARSNGLE